MKFNVDKEESLFSFFSTEEVIKIVQSLDSARSNYKNNDKSKSELLTSLIFCSLIVRFWCDQQRIVREFKTLKKSSSITRYNCGIYIDNYFVGDKKSSELFWNGKSEEFKSYQENLKKKNPEIKKILTLREASNKIIHTNEFYFSGNKKLFLYLSGQTWVAKVNIDSFIKYSKEFLSIAIIPNAF